MLRRSPSPICLQILDLDPHVQENQNCFNFSNRISYTPSQIQRSAPRYVSFERRLLPGTRREADGAHVALLLRYKDVMRRLHNEDILMKLCFCAKFQLIVQICIEKDIRRVVRRQPLDRKKILFHGTNEMRSEIENVNDSAPPLNFVCRFVVHVLARFCATRGVEAAIAWA